MRRRIVIEMDVEETEIFNDILKMVAERTDSNVECTIKQEIIPEKISREIQIPSFMNQSKVVSGQGKGMREALHKRGVMSHG